MYIHTHEQSEKSPTKTQYRGLTRQKRTMKITLTSEEQKKACHVLNGNSSHEHASCPQINI